MASESRALRPFETFGQTQSLFRELVKIATSDPKKGAALGHQRLALTRDEYLESDVVLWMGRSNEAHASLVETVDAEMQHLYPGLSGVINLVVSISNKRLKMTDLLLNIPLQSGSDIPMRIELHRAGEENSRPRPLQTPGDGCEVLVELLVGSDLDRQILQPERAWRKGSWLARVPIGIACSSDFSGPRPLPLTPAVRDQYSVAKNAVHYCRILSTNESLINASSLDDVLEYYVDHVVLAAVTSQPTELWSQRLQLEWILDAVKTFVLTAMTEPSFDEFDPTSSPGDESVLRAILEKVADATDGQSVSDAFDYLREDPSSFFADLEDRAGLLELQRELLPVGMETNQ
jgi:hypothetical protein